MLKVLKFLCIHFERLGCRKREDHRGTETQRGSGVDGPEGSGKPDYRPDVHRDRLGAEDAEGAGGKVTKAVKIWRHHFGLPPFQGTAGLLEIIDIKGVGIKGV